MAPSALEQSILRFLYRKRTVRLASKWSERMQSLMFTSAMMCLFVFSAPFDGWVAE